MAQTCQCGPRKEAILCLDGGGIRGYSSLLILKALMERCGQIEKELDRALLARLVGEDISRRISTDKSLPLPCHYFSYIFGTSTGGLSALMLGRLRMTIPEALAAYTNLANDVFGKRRPWNYYQLDHRRLEQAIHKVVQDHCKDKSSLRDGKDKLFDPEADSPFTCRCAVISLRREEHDKLCMFRSYFHPYPDRPNGNVMRSIQELNPGGDEHTFISQAARATSAAPRYFKEAEINSVRYMDGGLQANNPCHVAWNEAKQMHARTCRSTCDWSKGQHYHCNPSDSGIGILVSLGTGRAAPLNTFSDGNFFHKGARIFNRALKNMTDPEPVHHQMLTLTSGGRPKYFRLNVEKGLENIKMDSCEMHKSGSGKKPHNVTLNDIHAATEKYLSDPATQKDLDDCATFLVRKRRARTAGRHAERYRGLSMPGPLEDFHRTQQRKQDNIIDNVLEEDQQSRRSSMNFDPNQNDQAARSDPQGNHTGQRYPGLQTNFDQERSPLQSPQDYVPLSATSYHSQWQRPQYMNSEHNSPVPAGGYYGRASQPNSPMRNVQVQDWSVEQNHQVSGSSNNAPNGIPYSPSSFVSPLAATPSASNPTWTQAPMQRYETLSRPIHEMTAEPITHELSEDNPQDFRGPQTTAIQA